MEDRLKHVQRICFKTKWDHPRTREITKTKRDHQNIMLLLKSWWTDKNVTLFMNAFELLQPYIPSDRLLRVCLVHSSNVSSDLFVETGTWSYQQTIGLMCKSIHLTAYTRRWCLVNVSDWAAYFKQLALGWTDCWSQDFIHRQADRFPKLAYILTPFTGLQTEYSYNPYTVSFSTDELRVLLVPSMRSEGHCCAWTWQVNPEQDNYLIK